MNYLVVACSDRELRENLRAVIDRRFRGQFQLQFAESQKSLMERLDFELPEIVIFDFSDDALDMPALRKKILEDAWLHNFGIIGLYDKKKHREEELLEAYKEINVLTLIQYDRIGKLLAKSLEIIQGNRQLIFQDWLADKLVNRVSGSFVIDNADHMVVPVYTGLIAMSLVRRGKIPQDDRFSVQMALTELVLNGIEHGNCGISYADKTEYLKTGAGIHEMIIERLDDPTVAGKKVTLEWDIDDERCRFVIRDEGEGFDVMALREKLKTDERDKLSGRGIMMAQMVADKLSYNKRGNIATLVFNLDRTVENKVPTGFSGEETINVRQGDVLMRAGEFGDCIYYVASGKFTVYLHDRPVGRITTADIFMGEMAFLLSNTRSATVTADGPGKVIRIPRKSFISVIKEYPQYGIFLSKLLAQKLVRSNENASVAAAETVETVGTA